MNLMMNNPDKVKSQCVMNALLQMVRLDLEVLKKSLDARVIYELKSYLFQ